MSVFLVQKNKNDVKNYKSPLNAKKLTVNFKEIHIGEIIQQRVIEKKVEKSRICNFLKCSEPDIDAMYKSKYLDTSILLRWSKLLEYDFFRIYTQHLILFSPFSAKSDDDNKNSALPRFRKNIYTKEIIDFILELIKNNEKTKVEIIEEYRIPKTTLYKWIEKYSSKH